jgi:hypothetical protein
MAVLVKNASLITGDQTLYTGVDINKVGVNVNKLTLNRLLVSTSTPTSINVYAKAFNRASNSYVTFHIIQGLDLYKGSIVNIIPESISLTTSYTIYLAHALDKRSKPSSSISYYFDYNQVSDPQFVSSYEALNH